MEKKNVYEDLTTNSEDYFAEIRRFAQTYSQYFIRKNNVDKTWDSELANYCDMIINGLDNISPHFSETVV